MSGIKMTFSEADGHMLDAIAATSAKFRRRKRRSEKRNSDSLSGAAKEGTALLSLECMIQQRM